MYLNSAVTVKHMQSIAGAKGMNHKTPQRVLVALKVSALSLYSDRLAAHAPLRRPAFSVGTGPITHAVSVTPQELVHEIHKSLVCFEKGSQANVKTTNYFARIRHRNVLVEEPPNGRARYFKVDIDVPSPGAKEHGIRMRGEALLNICHPVGLEMNVSVELHKIWRRGQPVNVTDRKQFKVAIAILTMSGPVKHIVKTSQFMQITI